MKLFTEARHRQVVTSAIVRCINKLSNGSITVHRVNLAQDFAGVGLGATIDIGSGMILSTREAGGRVLRRTFQGDLTT